MGVNSFDTGFPIDFTAIRRELGPEVEIQGGVRAPQLAQGTPDEVDAEARRILESGIMNGGRFILKEANDLVPCTPLENMNALYQAARIYGVY
jgi:uroporphyrinogen decarboxylase